MRLSHYTTGLIHAMQSIYPCLQRRDQIKLKYTSSAAEIIFHEKTLDHAVKISRRNGRWVRTGKEPWRPAGESGVKVNLWRPLPPNQSDPCVAELVTACACGGFISLFINSRVMHAHAPVGGSMRGMGKAAAPPRLIGRVAVAVAAAWASPTALPAAAGQRPACPAACAVRAIRLGTATAATAALLRAAFRPPEARAADAEQPARF
jgi:hypothetical protein